MCLRPLDQQRRHLGVDEVVRQPDGDRQDDEDAADERDAFAGDAHHVLERRHVAMDESLHDERVERGDGRRLRRRRVAAEERPQHHDRQRISHFASQSAAPSSLEREGCLVAFV